MRPKVLPATYRQLDGDLVLATIVRLRQRVAERFPDSGLAGVVAELESVASSAIDSASDLARPIWRWRIAVWVAGLLLIAVVIAGLVSLTELRLESGLASMRQGIEAGVNNMVFLGVAVVFLTTVERRVKRRKVLAAIHELRSLAHIVDMHQLLKDPEIVLDQHTPTASSPERPFNRFELARYLDYCSETLSLSGKVAALYAQYHDDPVVLATVTEVETLATGISGKIWQKIVILDTVSRKP